MARQAGALCEGVAARLTEHRGAVFEVLDRAAVKEVAARMISALQSDLEDGGTEHLRRAVRALREEIPAKSFGFHDLHQLVRELQTALFDAIEGAPDVAPSELRAISTWISELGLCLGLELVLERDQRIERQEAELELRLADARENVEEKRRLSERLSDLISSVPGFVFEAARVERGRATSYVSDQVLSMTGYAPEEWLSRPDFWATMLHPDDRERAVEDASRIVAQGRGSHQFRWITKDGRTIWVEVHVVAASDEASAGMVLRGIAMDISARKHEEARREQLQAELIDLQQKQLVELSSPLIPISADVLVMPLIGGIDRARADRVLETLLAGISRARARFAILDITGVPTVDAETADALLRAARSVELLGAEVVLTGIRPEVAQTLVALGKDLSGIATRGTLQDGIAYAIERRGFSRTARPGRAPRA